MWVILPTGQGSFLLSPETPSSSHLTCFLGVTCVLGFACSHLSPARIPPCRRPQGVSPAWSQSSGSHHCLPLHHPPSQGPQRSLRRLSYCSSPPASRCPCLLTESGDAPWPRGVWVSFPQLLELCLPPPESAQHARCCLCASPCGVALVFRLGLQVARGVPVDSCPSGHPWSLVDR